MMDARLVWDGWRRLLTSDEISQWAIDGGAGIAPTTEGGAEMTGVLQDYAATPEATDINVGMYRNGLARNARAALSFVPVSRRIILSSGIDFDALATDFARSTAYRDYGPSLWTLAHDLLAFVAELPEFGCALRQDAFALDQTKIALALKLGRKGPTTWPEQAAGSICRSSVRLTEQTRFEANPAAALASLAHDLTPWVEDPDTFDVSRPLDASATFWLIYFPHAEADVEYAELSQRGAAVFRELSRPQTIGELAARLDVTQEDLGSVVDALLELGVIAGTSDDAVVAADTHAAVESFARWQSCGADRVFLDPAVESLAVEPSGARILVHTELEMGMSLPPGEGLSELLDALAAGRATVSALRSGFDHPELVDRLLRTLFDNGFLHSPGEGRGNSLDELRLSARRRRSGRARHRIEISLDGPDAGSRLFEALSLRQPAPLLVLDCMSLEQHVATLAWLKERRTEGAVSFHQLLLLAKHVECQPATARLLFDLAASVVIDDVQWPEPSMPVPGLDALVEANVAVFARMRTDRTILDKDARSRASNWARNALVSGLRLAVDCECEWLEAAQENDFAEIFASIDALAGELGDVALVGMPSDEVLLGTLEPRRLPDEREFVAEQLRKSYLKRRLAAIRASEADNSWCQTPEAEEKLVPREPDLLVSRPDLLGLRAGSVIVDVCAGIGRVTRRLAPALAPEGRVLAIELLPCLVDRARGFAEQEQLTNVEFRVGLAQRLPLASASVDAAVNEWTGAVWELGLGEAMLAEMARIVRPGGRVAVTHRLVNLPLADLHQPWVQYPEIYDWVRSAFARPSLRIIDERIWGVRSPSFVGEKASAWRKQYILPVIDPFDYIYDAPASDGPCADIFLTLIAERI